MLETGKNVGPPSGRHHCLHPDEAVALLSMGSLDLEAARLLSHMEACTSCRLLVGAAARERLTGAAAPRALCTLLPGDRLGDRYEVVRLLARGGMGEVYEARDELLGEVIALKTIVLSALDSQQALAALKAEVQLARKVSHRNVCRLLEFGIHGAGGGGREAVPFFTMELLRGETLRTRLRRTSALATAEALPIVLQIIEGLTAIHNAGIVHRDLKPENVFLLDERHELRAVVMDFGLARPLGLPEALASSEIDEGGVRPAGTLEYMAPEQLAGAQPNPAFDVYALGIIMFEMLSGNRPWSDRTGPWTATMGRLDQPAPRLSTVMKTAHPTWERVIERCLARDPGQRYRSIAEVRNALLPPAHPGHERPSPVRWRMALAGSALAVALLAAGFLSRQRASAPIAVPAPAPATASSTRADLPVPAVAGPPAPTAFRVQKEQTGTLRRAPRMAGRRPSTAAPPTAAATPAQEAPLAPAREDTSTLLDRAEQLLVAGQATAACALGERASAEAPRLPTVHRFLGKCYMRLPDAARARAHYVRYLELAPQAPDRQFVRAMVGESQ
jgi:hypothetical protein